MTRIDQEWESHERGTFVQRLIATESLSALRLVGGLATALVWSSLAPSSYSSFTTLAVHLPGVPPSMVHDLASLSANLLMVVFFFAIGLELSRERSAGALSERSSAILPVAAALGGMAGAALVFLLLASIMGAGSALSGWGIPMPTDVALGLAALALSANPAAGRLRVFLLTLAVADDVASVVILGWTSHATPRPTLALALLCAAGVLVVLGAAVVLRQARGGPVGFLILLLPLWWLLARLGVEPTLAGVAIGLLVPSGDDPRSAGLRLEQVVLPLSAFVVLPFFALTAAGVDLTSRPWQGNSGLVGALVGARVIGKAAGIVLASLVVVRLGAGALPSGVRWRHLGAMGVLCGIGFTVSLLFAQASFGNDPARMGATKLALVVGSVLCALVGLALLRFADGAPKERLSPQARPRGS